MPYVFVKYVSVIFVMQRAGIVEAVKEDHPSSQKVSRTCE